MHLYADDSTIYLTLDPENVTDIEFTISTIQSCIQDIKKWMTANYMKLNEGKTQLIIFGKPYNLMKYPNEFNIRLNDVDIKSSNLSNPGMKDEGKSLGVMLNNDTSMKRQISAVKRTISNTLHNLRNLKKFLTIDSKLTLVKSLVLSKLDYCNSLYMNIHYILSIMKILSIKLICSKQKLIPNVTLS